MPDCPAEPLDSAFLFFNGIFVLTLQSGFAMLEAGSVREKNATNILFKNILDCVLGSLCWFFFGFAFAFGEGGTFMGASGFSLTNVDKCLLPFYFFQWTFAATSTTIISGAMAERTRIPGYVSYSLLISGFVYPTIVHWVWSDNAWLADKGFADFAGSGVVHITGGTAALLGAYFVGPRCGRFTDKGATQGFSGHSVPLTALGVMILVNGFMAFNGGSVGSISGPEDAAMVGLAVTNTLIAAAGGGLAAVVGNTLLHRQFSGWSLLFLLNGMLGGMVSICAGAASIEPWAALLIGVVGGGVYLFWSGFIEKRQIDDPLDAVAVHFGCGWWGLIAEAIFNSDHGLLTGFGGEAWEHFGWQVAGGLVIMFWTALWAGGLFATLSHMDLLRVPDAEQEMGLDVVEHGEAAYPTDVISHGKPNHHR